MKFLRALQYVTSPTAGKDTPILFKAFYEFWGYCVNGGTSLTVPGGIPSNGTGGPAGFFEGSSVLATGNDGVTSAAYNTFTAASSTPFTPSMIGKHIVIWKNNSTSSDDSIYKIIGISSSRQIKIIVTSGATPDNSNLKPSLTARGSINYRVVDFQSASELITGDGNYYIVGTLTDANIVNSGQASSQFQIRLRSTNNLAITASPQGTWNGSSFTDTTLTEQNQTWFTSNTTAVQGNITLIADKTFFVMHGKGQNSGGNGGATLAAIIPQRLYSQVQDPNPIALLNTGNVGVVTDTSTGSYSNSFVMLCSDGVTRNHKTLVKSLGGDANAQGLTIGGLFTDPKYGFNQFNKKVVSSDGLLALTGVAGQYSFGRVILRVIKFCPSYISANNRIGNNGEGIHIGNGVLFPWDNSILSSNLMPFGS